MLSIHAMIMTCAWGSVAVIVALLWGDREELVEYTPLVRPERVPSDFAQTPVARLDVTK